MIQSNRRNLLMVTSDENIESKYVIPPPEYFVTNNTNTFWSGSFDAAEALQQDQFEDSYGWICSGLDYSAKDILCANRVEEIKSAPHTWKMGSGCSEGQIYCYRYEDLLPVDYCLSEPAPPLCKLHFSPVVAIIVTTLNFCKYTKSP